MTLTIRMNDESSGSTRPASTMHSGVAPQHGGRVLALQVLFEHDLAKHEWLGSLELLAEAIEAPPAAKSFAAGYVEGVFEHRSWLDDAIQRYAPMWPLEQIPAVDRNVLRIALYELRDGSPTPPKVAINEAVELAKEFGGEHSARFVNGVLGASLDERDSKHPADS